MTLVKSQKGGIMNVIWSDLLSLSANSVQSAPRKAGIYRLSYQNPTDSKYYIYYFGQAIDLNDRLNKHLPTAETNPCCKNYSSKYICAYKYALVDNQTDRDSAEAGINKLFHNTCVDRVPDVIPANINIE